MTIDTNRVLITGRLGQEPQLKQSSNGRPYVRLSVAVHHRDHTQWQDVMVWDKQAETCARHLVKGSQLLVEGRLEARDYVSKGSKRHIVQVIASRVQFLSGLRAAEVAEAEADDAASDKPFVDEEGFVEGEEALGQVV